MLLKASTDYGVRTVLYLAAKGDTRSSKEIAENMGIPRDYLIQLAQQLRNKGVITAQAGKAGGYRLAKAPEDTTLLEVLAALDDSPRNRARTEQLLNFKADLRLKASYNALYDGFAAYLEGITMATLLECSEKPDDTKAIIGRALEVEGKKLAQS